MPSVMTSPIDPEGNTAMVLACYGAAMLAVQRTERILSLLYAAVNVDPARASNASPARQWRIVTRRLTQALRKRSIGTKLNDPHTGVRQHLSPEISDRLTEFIERRNYLAHRLLLGSSLIL
jgi:hypothetical protein